MDFTSDGLGAGAGCAGGGAGVWARVGRMMVRIRIASAMGFIFRPLGELGGCVYVEILRPPSEALRMTGFSLDG
jgi:hypothetical protein